VRELVSLENPPVTITVKELPVAGQPENFSGAVGQFTLRARTDRDTLVAGNAYKLDITLEGRGNLPVIGAPMVTWPPAFENFEPEITESLNKTFSPMTGLKTYSIPFTPLRTGRHFLPSASLVYFDPAQGRYITLKTDSIGVDVVASAKQGAGQKVPGKRKGEDTVPEMEKGGIPWILVPMAVLVLVLAWWFSRSRRKKSVMPQRALEPFPEPEPEPVMQLRLFPATYNLDQAKSYLFARDAGRFYREIARVFRAVLAERYSIDAWQVREELESGMRRAQIDGSVAAELAALVEHCQMAVYAPLADPAAMDDDYEKAERLLDILQPPAGEAPSR
jgi:hypothetical protein